MKRKLNILAAILILTAATAFGAGMGHMGTPGTPGTPGSTPCGTPAAANGPGMGQGMGFGGDFLHPQLLIEFLDLTEAQQAQISTLRESFRATVAPIHEQIAANRAKIEDAVAAGDAAAAGALLIQNRDLQAEVKAAREAFSASVLALLTDAQKAKWEIYQELVDLMGRGPRR